MLNNLKILDRMVFSSVKMEDLSSIAFLFVEDQRFIQAFQTKSSFLQWQYQVTVHDLDDEEKNDCYRLQRPRKIKKHPENVVLLLYLLNFH